MPKLLDEIRDAWGSYPRGWVSIFAPLVAFATASWWGAGLIVDVAPGLATQINATVLKLLLASAISGSIYVVFDVLYYWSKRGRSTGLLQNIDSEFNSIIGGPDCNELLVFASGGEEAKGRLLNLTNEKFLPKRTIEIKVLLRSDGSEQRLIVLKQMAEKWRKDIDWTSRQADSGYCFKSEFSLYSVPVMYKGYVFGKTAAALSWYARSNDIRSSPKVPFLLIKHRSDKESAVIDQARAAFFHFYEAGVKI